MSKYAVVAGTGSYLPITVISNADLETMVDTTDQWIVDRTGISERRKAAADETAASMGTQAATAALNAAGVPASDLDLIIVATCSPDRVFPSTACILQNNLQAGTCPAFDLAAACSGFIYALNVADQAVRSGNANHVLVVGSEVMSRVIDWQDRSTCILFGDGAGAVVLSASDQPGIMGSVCHADGRYQDLLYIPNPLTGPDDGGNQYMRMRGNDVFKQAVRAMDAIVDEVLVKTTIDKADIDWLIPHQANERIIRATAKKLNLPMEKVIMTLAKQGNTSSASIPLALDEAVRDGRVQRGQHLLLEGFGGGLCWGATVVRY